MSNASKQNYGLSAQQTKAAELLVSNDIHRLTMEQIAEQCGVSRVGLWKWRNDPDFIAYKNELAERRMDDFLADAYEMVRGMAKAGQSEKTRLKALEIVLKNRGKLTDVQKVEQTVKDERSTEAILADIERLEAMVQK